LASFARLFDDRGIAFDAGRRLGSGFAGSPGQPAFRDGSRGEATPSPPDRHEVPQSPPARTPKLASIARISPVSASPPPTSIFVKEEGHDRRPDLASFARLLHVASPGVAILPGRSSRPDLASIARISRSKAAEQPLAAPPGPHARRIGKERGARRLP
jgi:hypothetical protein